MSARVEPRGWCARGQSEDVDDARAREDWGWKAAYSWERAFDEYLVPSIQKRYSEPPPPAK